MLTAVQWESFLNDLIVAYVLMQPATALTSLQKRIDQSIAGKFGERAARCVSFDVEKPTTRQHVVGLLDPKDWNITVASANELSAKANEFLAARFAKRFSLGKADAEFIDFSVALRNYLGHLSDGSRTVLKTKIDAFSETTNTAFKATLGNVGVYLKTKDASGITRAVSFALRLIEISTKL